MNGTVLPSVSTCFIIYFCLINSNGIGFFMATKLIHRTPTVHLIVHHQSKLGIQAVKQVDFSTETLLLCAFKPPEKLSWHWIIIPNQYERSNILHTNNGVYIWRDQGIKHSHWAMGPWTCHGFLWIPCHPKTGGNIPPSMGQNSHCHKLSPDPDSHPHSLLLLIRSQLWLLRHQVRSLRSSCLLLNSHSELENHPF